MHQLRDSSISSFVNSDAASAKLVSVQCKPRFSATFCVFEVAKIKHTTKSTYFARIESLIVFLGAGASNVFGIPTMPGFIKIFDKEIGEYRELYQGIKNSFSGDEFDLEVLMMILEDLTKERNEMFKTVSPQTTELLLRMPRKEALRFIRNKEVKVLAKELLVKLKQIIRRECRKAVEDNKQVDNILSKYDHLFKILSKAPTEVNLTSGDGETEYPTNLDHYNKLGQLRRDVLQQAPNRILERNHFKTWGECL